MKFETLVTERLVLRKLTPEAFTFIFENYSEEQIKKELGISSEVEYVKEQEKYKMGYSTYNRSLVYFQLIDKFTNEIIGGCGFHNWFIEHSRAEIGYSLAKEKFMGLGLMTEAIAPIIEYGFNKMDLNRIEAFIGPDNQASLKLLKKNNFKQEGYLRQHYFKNGLIEDSILFSLLREEYRI